MSLITRINALATRVANEFNNIRNEYVSIADIEDHLPDRISQNSSYTLNWNNAVTSGFYISSGAANEPAGGHYYYAGEVVRVSQDFIVQNVYPMNDDNPSSVVTRTHYRRVMQQNAWSSWEEVSLHSASEITSGTLNTARLPAATTTAIGAVELATNAETTTGTDTVRAVTPAGVKAVADTKANTTHNHAATDINSGVLANARLPERLRELQVTTISDLNTAVTSGWYTSTSNPTNAPIAGAFVWGVFVDGHFANYLTQTASILIYGSIGNQYRYRRIMTNGTWGGWFIIEDSPVALAAYFATATHQHAGADITSGTVDIAYLPVASSGELSSTKVVRADDTRLGGASYGNVGFKRAAYVATTGNITLSGFQTIDGVAVSTGSMVVLVKNQTDPVQNGMYTPASGAWTRTADMPGVADVSGDLVYVQQGAVSGGTIWAVSATGTAFVGSEPVNFVRVFPAPPPAMTIYTSSSTFSIGSYPGATAVRVRVQGGGGGGGGAAATNGSSNAHGGGGGGGCCVESIIPVADLTASVSVTVGSGGSAGSTGGGNGGNGGQSSFGGYVLANGGNGGAGSAQSSTNLINAGGVGGGSGGGTASPRLIATGDDGGNGVVAAGLRIMGGRGGASTLGGGGRPSAQAGGTYGGGGGGASNATSATGTAGGAGAAGCVVVEVLY